MTQILLDTPLQPPLLSLKPHQLLLKVITATPEPILTITGITTNPITATVGQPSQVTQDRVRRLAQITVGAEGNAKKENADASEDSQAKIVQNLPTNLLRLAVQETVQEMDHASMEFATASTISQVFRARD